MMILLFSVVYTHSSLWINFVGRSLSKMLSHPQWPSLSLHRPGTQYPYDFSLSPLYQIALLYESIQICKVNIINSNPDYNLYSRP